MGGELARKFAEELIRCREESDHNRLSVEHFSRGEAARRGEEFFVHNTSLLKYEKGGWPSPPKMITMARAYGVPVARFLKALGAEDRDICGHVVQADEQKLFEALRDPVASDLHRKLQALIESSAEESRAALAVLEMAAARMVSGRRSAKVGARTVRETAAKWISLDLPYFPDRLPEGAPGDWKTEDTRAVAVEDASEVTAGYLTRAADDSLSPEVTSGDLVLVDWSRRPKSGSIVCARLNGNPLMRQWLRQGPKRVLRAFDPERADVAVKEDDRLELLGVVLRVVERDLTGL